MEHKDQYIISYKLNSTWIDPQGVCGRLRTVDECTVNPTHLYGGVESNERGEGPVSEEELGWGGERGRDRATAGLSLPVRGSPTSNCLYLPEALPPIYLCNVGLVWTQSIL